jgi:hypothetical protein
MSQPFPERLSRFTPDAGTLDRDGLLYAAGRASARPNRGWIALAAALAVAEVLTLVVLWPSPAPPVAQLPPPAVQPPAPGPAPEAPTPDAPDSPGVWSVRHGLQEPDAGDRPEPANPGTVVDSGPPLRAVGPPPLSLLN